MMTRFAELYKILLFELMRDIRRAGFACRGLPMAKELTHTTLTIEMPGYKKISVFSRKNHRVVPIRFVLAELCHILAGRDDLESLLSYHAGMAKYSHDGVTLAGAYGKRLAAQLPRLIQRLEADPYTRQACAAIFNEDDCLTTTRTSVPCNVYLQFLQRNGRLDLHVISRSSDFVTGFSIDTLHWQALLVMMTNEFPEWQVGSLYYTIGSLHIYECDMPVIAQWKLTDYTYEHFLRFMLPLSAVRHQCQVGFTGGLQVRDLAALLGLADESVDKVLELEQIFLYHRNKLQR
jgi:hypothetical protein